MYVELREAFYHHGATGQQPGGEAVGPCYGWLLGLRRMNKLGIELGADGLELFGLHGRIGLQPGTKAGGGWFLGRCRLVYGVQKSAADFVLLRQDSRPTKPEVMLHRVADLAREIEEVVRHLGLYGWELV